MAEESNLNDPTSPVRADSEKTQPFSPVPSQPDADLDVHTSNGETTKPPKSLRGRFILGGFVVILLLGALGAFLGYQSGLQSRVAFQNSQIASAAATQFQLGLDDMANGRFQMARGRFEYVISLDPNFPGVKEKLTQVLLTLAPTSIPTPSATPTAVFTPTPDTRGEQELLKQIQENLADKKWDAAIVAIESLRTKNLGYETIAVDGYYYVALRNRGVDKILRQGELEGGMYDLALVERFGPLDRDAESYRVWSRYYITGASFWQVDWEKATYYFGLVAPFLPNLRDSSNVFAIDRYRQAATGYAEKLIDDGDPCKASELLSKVLVNNYRNAKAEELAKRAGEECNPPTETPEPPSDTATPQATLAQTATAPAAPSATIQPTASTPSPQPSATQAVTPAAPTPTS